MIKSISFTITVKVYGLVKFITHSNDAKDLFRDIDDDIF